MVKNKNIVKGKVARKKDALASGLSVVTFPAARIAEILAIFRDFFRSPDAQGRVPPGNVSDYASLKFNHEVIDERSDERDKNNSVYTERHFATLGTDKRAVCSLSFSCKRR